jgi:macrolide transport system ATP-binding/permease protein
LLESLVSDVRFAFRWLRKSPGFTAVAVASLAIGIGFNTALFAVVDALLFRPLPVVHPEQLVDAYTTAPSNTARERLDTSSYPDYLDLKAHNEVFDDLIGYSPMFAALKLGDRSRLTLGEIVTGNYFRALGVGASMGRTILPEDDLPGVRVAMISYGYWTRELGGRSEIIGSTLKLRGHPYTIVGIAPRGFNGMTSILSPDLWVPVQGAMDVEPVGMHDVVPSPTGTTRLDRRGDRWLFMKGRIKFGVTLERARANLQLIMARLEETNPATNRGRHIAVRGARDVRFQPAADPVLAVQGETGPPLVPIAAGFMGVVGLVLLIACANVASMLLARASGRQREIGVRLAIGATRGRLVQQLVTESLVLSMLGAVTGVLVAWWITSALRSVSLPVPIPLAFDLRIDTRVLVFTFLATLAAGVLAGLAPALKASSPRLTAELKGEQIVSRAGGGWTLRDALVAGQMAVTVLLLILAALLTRSLLAAQKANVGLPVERLALVSLDTGMAGYSRDQSKQFYEQALARVGQIPGVESVALATRPPFSLNSNRWNIWIPGRHALDNPGDVVEVTRVSHEYFQTLGVAVREGRVFTADDRPDSPRVAVVNETMARNYWPGESAIDKTFRARGSDGPLFTIVGVVADHKVTAVGEGPTPFIHFARDQQPNSYSAVVARTHGDASALLRDMRRELLGIEPNLVFVESQTMHGEVAATLFPARASALLVSTIGMMAMVLASIGLYGVIAYSVARRTREIGIRIALGARPSSVLGLVMRQGLAVVGVGLVIGCLFAAFAAWLMAGLLYGVSAGDPISWVGAAGVLLGVSALANILPARRAARVDPSITLRVE